MPDEHDDHVNQNNEDKPKTAPELPDDIATEDHDDVAVEEDAVVKDSKSEDGQDDSTNNTEIEAADSPEEPDHEVEEPPKADKKPGKLKHFWQAALRKKKLFISLAVLAMLAILLAVPLTRYKLLGLVIKKQFSVFVVDSKTSAVITNATVNLEGHITSTNNNGAAQLVGIPVGSHSVTVSKKYYKDLQGKVMVSLSSAGSFNGPQSATLKLEATGRQVPVVVTNKITSKPVENVAIKVADTEAKTDKDGKATVVLPADKEKLDGTISGSGYNETKITVTVSESAVKDNTFTITPSGKLYFLSKKSGKIDVVKTDLDGANRQTVIAGTDKEEEGGTVLLASRDWKYLALLARRDSDKPKLYLIDTSSDKLSTMDEGDATFEITGWIDHSFVYIVRRNGLQAWQPKQTAIKAYNAETAKLTVIDETSAVGDQNSYAQEIISWIFGVGNKIQYFKTWSAQHTNYSTLYPELDGKQDQIIGAGTDGTKKIIKTYAIDSTSPYYGNYYSPLAAYQSILYEPAAIFFSTTLPGGKAATYNKLENDQVAENDKEATDYFKGDSRSYPTYLSSPSGNETFWSESRDGKNTLFIGDKDGKNGKEIGALTDFSPYGWYTDDYVLVSKNASELYIFGRDGLKDGQTPLKITDYHKPDRIFNGYGGGYGGI